MNNLRLTVFTKFLLTFLIVGGFGYGLYFFANNTEAGRKMAEQTNNTSISDESNQTITTPRTTEQATKTVETFKPVAMEIFIEQPPITNPVYGGVVTVGSKSFDAFVFKQQKGTTNYELVNAEYGLNKIKNVISSTQASQIVNEVKDKIITMMREHGAPGKNIHFELSSGAQKNPNMKVLVEALKKKGYIVNKTTIAREATYGFIASVPIEHRDESGFVDIGGGNTKVGAAKGKNVVTCAIDYGTKMNTSQMGEAMLAINDCQGMLADKETIFFIGGIVFINAAKIYGYSPEQVQDVKYLSLDYNDIKRYYDAVKMSNVEEVIFYSREEYINGTALLLQFMENNPGADFVFNTNANWAIGPVLSYND